MGAEQLIRQWRLIEILSGSRFGVSVGHLLEALGTSKSTFYRDRDTLLAAGFPICTEKRGEHSFYWLESGVPASGDPTPLQLAALKLARTFLEPVSGTRLVTQYDTLLARYQRATTSAPSIRTTPVVQDHASMLQTIDEAMHQHKRVKLTYENAEGQLGERVVDPIELKIEQSVQVYFHAYDIEKKSIKTYKPARMKAAQIIDQPSAPHPEFASDEPFANAVKTWSAPPLDVAIRISPRKARFLGEYPLKEQRLDPQPDGSVIVRATVAGPQEITKWILSWGRDALVLSPPELRQSLRDELTAMLAGYDEA